MTEKISAVEPCSTEYCFMSRDDVLEGTRGSVFTVANFMMKLVADEGEVPKDQICQAVADINAIDCEGGGVCPRYGTVQAILKNWNGDGLLERAMAGDVEAQVREFVGGQEPLCLRAPDARET